ncbi:hypothetical protein ACWPKO_17345 [Coraliomargarita sp. W4R53]
MARDNFSASVKQKVAERAGFLCSNPTCNRMTIGPCTSNSSKSTKTGEAAHICAASPGGPRYNMGQTSAQRAGIGNAIWLCGTCAILIDKNKGLSYPESHLRRWKNDHEDLVKECLEGEKRFLVRGNIEPSDRPISRKIVKFLEPRGVLFVPFDDENKQHVFESVKEIRTFLTALSVEVSEGTALEVIIDSMNQACRHFMNTTSTQMDDKEIGYSLGAMRKAIGLNLRDLIDQFNVTVNSPLIDSIPQ